MSPTEYIAAAPEEKRADLKALDTLIKRITPKFTPYALPTMLAYGRYHYRYESGREGVSCRVGLACTKGGFSLYVSAVDEGGWLAEQAKASLGKANVGKSCIRFKRLSDLDLRSLEKLLQRSHGMLGPSEVAPSTTTRAAPKKKL